MEQISKLENPTVISINGENYIVLKQKELFFDDIKKTMDMCVELVKESEPNLSPMFRLIYVRENLDRVKFYGYDAKIDRFIERNLESLELNKKSKRKN